MTRLLHDLWPALSGAGSDLGNALVGLYLSAGFDALVLGLSTWIAS
jgi:hypothetical protein